MGSRQTLSLVLIAALCAGVGLWWIESRESGSSARGGAAAPLAPGNDAVASAPAHLESPAALAGEGASSKTPRAAIEAPIENRSASSSGSSAVPKGPKLRGRVVDKDGVPVSGARVITSDRVGFPLDYAEESALPFARRSLAETDADGRFEIVGTRAGQVRVLVRKGGFAPLEKHGLSVPDEPVVELDPLVLTRGAILSGRVVDMDGIGVGGAELSIVEEESGFFFGGMVRREPLARSAADGSFRLDEVACGPWRVTVHHEQHPDLVQEGLTERPGEETSSLLLELRPGAEIAGQVAGIPAAHRGTLEVVARRVGEEGSLFPGMSIGAARRASVQSGGAFLLRGLEVAESYELEARSADRKEGDEFFFEGRSRSERVAASAGDQGVVIPWQPEGAITFQVLDAKTGLPVTEFRVNAGSDWAVPLLGADRKPLAMHPGGRVRVGNLRPRTSEERVVLEIVAKGYERYSREDIALAAGDELDLGPIVLEPVPLVRVSVLDGATQMPVVGANVRLEEERPQDIGVGGFARSIELNVEVGDDAEPHALGVHGGAQSAKTDERGIAEITSLEGKTVTIHVSSRDHAPARIEGVFLPEGDVVERAVELGVGGGVIVRVVDARGNPIPGEHIDHRDPFERGGPGPMIFGGPSARGSTDDAGELGFDHLTPGVHAFKIGGERGEAMFGGGSGAVFSIQGLQDPEEEAWREVEIEEGKTATLLLQGAPRGSLIGRVREAGTPLAGATLSLRSSSEEADPFAFELPGMFRGGSEAKSDGHGEYALEDVKEGEYLLSVTHPTRRMPQDFPVRVSEGENRFDVELTVSIVEGRVSSPDGKGMAGVEVTAERASQDGAPRQRFGMMLLANDDGDVVAGGGPLGGASTRTDSDGSYQLRGVTPDVDLIVKVEGDLVQTARSESFRVSPDQTKVGVDVRVELGGEIRVEATAADGSPARFCTVNATFEDSEAEVEPEFSFLQSGSTSLKGLKPGRWRVALQPAGPGRNEGAPQEQVVEVVASESRTASFTLP